MIRRFSGGGTVFHDVGNINFSFIVTGKDSKVIDFKHYALPIVNFLRSLGIHAELSERNDILIEGFKVSGHAAHAKNKRSLHHGTLLYNSNLQKLSKGLKSTPDKFKSRAVQSVRSPVANVNQYFSNKLDISEFVEMLGDYLLKEFPTDGYYQLTNEDKVQVEKLVADKYKTFDWNYGYGPDYSFECQFEIDSESIELKIEVSKGVIVDVEILKKSTFDGALKELTGIRHFWQAMNKKLTDLFGEKQGNQLIDHFF